MRATVILDHKFLQAPDGRIASLTMFGDSFWQRYLEVFDSLRVICRARPLTDRDQGYVFCNDPRIQFEPVPYYEGPQGFFWKSLAIRRRMWQWLTPGEAYILRVPQILPNVAFSVLKKKRIPFGVEVVGDPWDLYAPGAESHPLRPLIRRWSSSRLREICARAEASSYVTQAALQRRYPPADGSFTTHCSSVELEKIEAVPRKFIFNQRPAHLLFVGALNRLYKGQDTLLEAVSVCCHQLQLPVRLTVVGEGQYLPRLRQLASELKIVQRVEFAGGLPRGEAVFQKMVQADLFVLPSRQEGLPRAMIEAMGTGLPCIASDVGGISELLDASSLVPPDNPLRLAEAIVKLVQNPQRMEAESVRNLQTASDYISAALRPRRVRFYESLLATVRGERIA